MKLKKIVIIASLVLYGIWLFLLCVSYISYSVRFPKSYFHVASSPYLQAGSPNIFQIWAFERVKDFDFSHYQLHISIADENSQDKILSEKWVPLQSDGTAIFSIALPDDPKHATEFYHTAFELTDEDGEVTKNGFVRLPQLSRTESIFIQPVDDPRQPFIFRAAHPNPYFNDIQNYVLVAAFYPNGTPYSGEFFTETTFGHMEQLDHRQTMNRLGMSRMDFSLRNASDLKLQFPIDEGQFFERYISFSLLSRNIQVFFPDGSRTITDTFPVQLHTLSGHQTAYVELYDHASWIYHSKFSDIGNSIINIQPNLFFDEPRLVTLSICLSAWSCEESANAQNVILSPHPLSLIEETSFALENLSHNPNMSAYAQHLLKQLPEASDDELRLARDFALEMIPKSTTGPSIVLNTELLENHELATAKETHKFRANVALIFTFAVGFILIVLCILHFHFEKKHLREMLENMDDDEANAEEEIPEQQKFGEITLYVAFLFLLLCMAGGLFFMFQII